MKVITKKIIKREILISFYDKKNKKYFETEMHTMATNYRKEISAYAKTVDAKYLGFTVKKEIPYAVSMNIERFIEYADEIIELGKSDLENESEEI